MNPLKLIVALVAILFSSCRCDKEELVFSCPQPEPCYLEYGKDNNVLEPIITVFSIVLFLHLWTLKTPIIYKKNEKI